MASFHDQLVVVLLAVLLAAALVSGASAVEAQNPFTSAAAMEGKGQARALRAGDRMLHRMMGCKANPEVCMQPSYGKTSMCCSNTCVDVSKDTKNCGACGKCCSWGFSCCKGKCCDLNTDPANCGEVGKKCKNGVKCAFGMCGYSQE